MTLVSLDGMALEDRCGAQEVRQRLNFLSSDTLVWHIWRLDITRSMPFGERVGLASHDRTLRSISGFTPCCLLFETRD